MCNRDGIHESVLGKTAADITAVDGMKRHKILLKEIILKYL